MILAPKLRGNLVKPLNGSALLGGGPNTGSSSILNLPVLGNDNTLMTSNRNKGIESSKHLYRNEEHKIVTSANPIPNVA